MTGKTVNFGPIIDIITFISVIVIFFLVVRSRKKAIEKPSGEVLTSEETKIGEIFCESETRGVSFKGFVIADSALEGKLILTNRRLLYSTHDEKKIGLSLEPKNISSIHIGKKGFLTKTPTLSIDYIDKKNKLKTATWTFPETLNISEPLFSKGSLLSKLARVEVLEYKNPQTMEEFSKLLLNWKGQTNDAEVFGCSACGALVPASTKQCPKCKSDFEETLPNEK